MSLICIGYAIRVATVNISAEKLKTLVIKAIAASVSAARQRAFGGLECPTPVIGYCVPECGPILERSKALMHSPYRHFPASWI
jgi:hypothetical protein